VNVDAQRLTHAILNLASNAARHTPVRQAITLGASASANELTLWVADTGEGISERDHDRIFEPFGRARSQQVPGGRVGLGLAPQEETGPTGEIVIVDLGGFARDDPTETSPSTRPISIPATSPR